MLNSPGPCDGLPGALHRQIQGAEHLHDRAEYQEGPRWLRGLRRQIPYPKRFFAAHHS